MNVVIGNKSVGLNVIDLTTMTLKELVSKQSREIRRKSSIFEEEKSSPVIGEGLDKQNLQWQLQIRKTGDLQRGFMTDIVFESVSM
jgi:hypothetical protein